MILESFVNVFVIHIYSVQCNDEKVLAEDSCIILILSQFHASFVCCVNKQNIIMIISFLYKLF